MAFRRRFRRSRFRRPLRMGSRRRRYGRRRSSMRRRFRSVGYRM